jgi:hypothetical protein
MKTYKEYQDFFHNLHCILRDGVIGLTGLNALNEINNLILIIFIEPKYNKLGIEDHFKFSHCYNNTIRKILKSKHHVVKKRPP